MPIDGTPYVLRPLEYLTDGGDDTCPLPLLRCQLAAAGRSERVGLHAPAFLVRAPFPGNPAVLLQSVERGEEGARLHVEGAAGQLADPIGHADAVQRLQFERAQDQQIERAAEQVGSFFT